MNTLYEQKMLIVSITNLSSDREYFPFAILEIPNILDTFEYFSFLIETLILPPIVSAGLQPVDL